MDREILNEWIAELERAANQPDRGDDGHTAWQITEKGRVVRELAKKRLAVLRALVG